ncbi:hypothetical protein ABZP36_023262 [Zizania latifolia]
MVVVVEEEEEAVAAGDCTTLLHICSPARSCWRRCSLWLGSFQLALAFKGLCNGIVEVVRCTTISMFEKLNNR